MELADLEAAVGPAQPKFRAKQIYDAIYRRRVTSLDQVSNLPKALRELSVGLLEIERAFDSCLLYTSPSPRDS